MDFDRNGDMHLALTFAGLDPVGLLLLISPDSDGGGAPVGAEPQSYNRSKTGSGHVCGWMDGWMDMWRSCMLHGDSARSRALTGMSVASNTR